MKRLTRNILIAVLFVTLSGCRESNKATPLEIRLLMTQSDVEAKLGKGTLVATNVTINMHEYGTVQGETWRYSPTEPDGKTYTLSFHEGKVFGIEASWDGQ
jgi:hypothetical protein